MKYINSISYFDYFMPSDIRLLSAVYSTYIHTLNDISL